MKTAVLFPGLGSEYPDMVEGFSRKHPEHRKLITNTIERGLERALEFQFSNQQDALDALKIQLSIHSLNVAWFNLLFEKINPSYCAGHSLGFYAASVCSESVKNDDAVDILSHAFCMAWYRLHEKKDTESPTKKVAVITTFSPIDIDLITSLNIEILSNNNKTQLLVYAEEKILSQLLTCLKDDIISSNYFPYALPFHSKDLLKISSNLITIFDHVKFKDPKIHLFSHIKDETICNAEKVHWHLFNQIHLPIYWPSVTKALREQCVGHVYELGPNRILTQMMRWSEADMIVQSVDQYRPKKDTKPSINTNQGASLNG